MPRYLPIAAAAAVLTALLAAASAFAQDFDLDWERDIGLWYGSCAEATFISPASCSVGTLDGNRAGIWVHYRLVPDSVPDPTVRVIVDSIFVELGGPLVFTSTDGTEAVFEHGYMILNYQAVELTEDPDIAAVLDMLAAEPETLTVSVPLTFDGPMIANFDTTDYLEARAALDEHVAGWPVQ